MSTCLALRRLSGDYSVCRLDADAPIPAWADGGGFVSISRSAEELSVLCRSERVPADVRQDGPWACFALVGPFAFEQGGIVLAVIRPLSEAGLGVFVVSTFDGDHVMVKAHEAERAVYLLGAAGHRVA